MERLQLQDHEVRSTTLRAFSSVVLRLALGFSFLSAVADRFGLWGAYGEPNVAWGTFDRFVAYTGQLSWFAPKAAVSPGQLRGISIQHRSAEAKVSLKTRSQRSLTPLLPRITPPACHHAAFAAPG